MQNSYYEAYEAYKEERNWLNATESELLEKQEGVFSGLQHLLLEDPPAAQEGCRHWEQIRVMFGQCKHVISCWGDDEYTINNRISWCQEQSYYGAVSELFETLLGQWFHDVDGQGSQAPSFERSAIQGMSAVLESECTDRQLADWNTAVEDIQDACRSKARKGWSEQWSQRQQKLLDAIQEYNVHARQQLPALDLPREEKLTRKGFGQ